MFCPLAPLASQNVEPAREKTWQKKKPWQITPEHPQDMLHLQSILDNGQESQDNSQESQDNSQDSQDNVLGEFVSYSPHGREGEELPHDAECGPVLQQDQLQVCLNHLLGGRGLVERWVQHKKKLKSPPRAKGRKSVSRKSHQGDQDQDKIYLNSKCIFEQPSFFFLVKYGFKTPLTEHMSHFLPGFLEGMSAMEDREAAALEVPHHPHPGRV